MKPWIQIGMISVSLCVIVVKGCDYLSSKRTQRDQFSVQATALPSKKDSLESSVTLPPKNSLAEKSIELSTLAKVDLAAVIRSLNEMEFSIKQSTIIMDICDQLKELSSEETEKLIHETQWPQSIDDSERILLTVLLENWSRTAPEAVWEWIRTHDIQVNEGHRSFKGYILPQLMQILWKQNPDRAVEIMNGLREDPVFMITSFSLAGAMAESDFHQALEFAYNMDGKGSESQCLKRVMVAYAHAHPEEAMEEYRKTEDANVKAALGEAIAKQLAEIDSRNAYEFASQLPEGMKGSAIQEVAQKWAQSDPQEMQDYMKNLPLGEERSMLFVYFSSALSQQDPEAAAKWFTSQAIGAYTPSASESGADLNHLSRVGFDICLGLYEMNPSKGRKWLNALDAGSLRDNIIHNLIINRREDNPQKAMKLARSIQNQEMRMTTQRKMIRNAFSGDPDKAKQLMNSMNIPQQEQAEILKSSAR